MTPTKELAKFRAALHQMAPESLMDTRTVHRKIKQGLGLQLRLFSQDAGSLISDLFSVINVLFPLYYESRKRNVSDKIHKY